MPRSVKPIDLSWFFRHTVSVERLVGHGATGDVYGPSSDVLALIDDNVRLVRNQQGDEVVSSTTVNVAIDTSAIPPGSRVTLPAEYGGRVTTVITAGRHDGGGLPVPDLIELALQ